MGAVLQFRNTSGQITDVDLEKFKRRDFAALIRSSTEYDQEAAVWERIQQKDTLFGDAMPWPKTHQKLRFRPGEVTAWIGPNRDGKSLLLGYIAAHWALQETRVLMCSLEMDIAAQLKRITRQLLCTESPAKSEFEMLMARLLHLHFVDYVGHLPPFHVNAMVWFAAAEAGYRHIVIDNLTLIVPPGRNTDESSAVFVRGLVDVARATGAHIHLVGHVRKPDAKQPFLNRYDWRGTGACADMVHNVVIVQSNEKKRRGAEEGDSSMGAEADVFVIVDKQRSAAFHGRLGFWWRPDSLQLVANWGDDPMRFDPNDFSTWER